MNANARDWPAVRGARLRSVLEVEFNHGAGTPDDPVRRVFAYYDTDNPSVLLAITDPTIDVSMMATRWPTRPSEWRTAPLPAAE